MGFVFFGTMQNKSRIYGDIFEDVSYFKTSFLCWHSMRCSESS